MTVYYVSSVDGSDADAGTSWALAKATLAGVSGALSLCAAGDIVYIDSAHVEGATATININAITSSLGNPVIVLSINRSDDTYLAGAKVNIASGTNAAIQWFSGTADGAYVFRGITFECSSTANSTANDINFQSGAGGNVTSDFYDCTFTILATSTTAQFILGRNNSGGIDGVQLRYINCTWNLTNANVTTGCLLLGNAKIEMVNQTFAYSGATKPTALFGWQDTNTSNSDLVLRDSDLSGYNTTSGAFFLVTGFARGSVVVKNCKIDSTPTFVSGTFPADSASITIRNVDSGDTINVFEYRNRRGTLTENASIYAASGASFNSGSVSWEVVTTSACAEGAPFILPPLSIWNTSTSSQTATVQTVQDSATALTDREIWLEVSSPASASFPNYQVGSDRNSSPFLATGASQTSSSVTWTGTGGFTNENRRSLDVTFTAAEVGLIEGVVSIGKASTTVYIDPLLRLA